MQVCKTIFGIFIMAVSLGTEGKAASEQSSSFDACHSGMELRAVPFLNGALPGPYQASLLNIVKNLAQVKNVFSQRDFEIFENSGFDPAALETVIKRVSSIAHRNALLNGIKLLSAMRVGASFDLKKFSEEMAKLKKSSEDKREIRQEANQKTHKIFFPVFKTKALPPTSGIINAFVARDGRVFLFDHNRSGGRIRGSDGQIIDLKKMAVMRLYEAQSGRVFALLKGRTKIVVLDVQTGKIFSFVSFQSHLKPHFPMEDFRHLNPYLYENPMGHLALSMGFAREASNGAPTGFFSNFVQRDLRDYVLLRDLETETNQVFPLNINSVTEVFSSGRRLWVVPRDPKEDVLIDLTDFSRPQPVIPPSGRPQEMHPPTPHIFEKKDRSLAILSWNGTKVLFQEPALKKTLELDLGLHESHRDYLAEGPNAEIFYVPQRLANDGRAVLFTLGAGVKEERFEIGIQGDIKTQILSMKSGKTYAFMFAETVNADGAKKIYVIDLETKEQTVLLKPRMLEDAIPLVFFETKDGTISAYFNSPRGADLYQIFGTLSP